MKFPEVCSYVARLANKGELEQAVLKGRPWDDESFPMPKESLSGGVVFKDRIDLNNDGRPDYVYILSQGTAHFEGVVIYDSNLKEINYSLNPGDDWETDSLRWASDYRILRYRGKHYIIGKSDDYLNYVATIGPDNVKKVLCEFGQRKNPATHLRSGSDEKVCKAALAAGLEYAAFDKLHAVTVEDLRKAGLHQTHPGERAAKVDIDNDGVPEYVIQTKLASGAGRGCDTSGLAIVNETRTELSETPVAKLLRETGGGCDGVRLLPFSFDGKTYLEHKYPEGHPTNRHAVYIIEGGKRRDMCGIDVRVINYVLSEYEAFMRAAKSSYKGPWDYALSKPSLSKAELLVRNGHSVNDTIGTTGTTPLLSWAAWQGREDLLDWLLKKGANPNVGKDRIDTPLWEAVARTQSGTMAVRLLEAGADPSKVLHEIEDFAKSRPDEGRQVMGAAVRRLGYIPEQFVTRAISSTPALIEDFVQGGLLVQLESRDWYAGEKAMIPFWVRASAYRSGKPEIQEKLDRLYRRGTKPPESRFLHMDYGTFEQGWLVKRENESPIADNEFLWFATSICYYFLPVNCGSDTLIRSANAWAQGLSYSCHERLVGVLDPVACRLAMHYAKIGTGKYWTTVSIYPVTSKTLAEGMSNLQLDDLRDLYLAKKSRR